MCFGCSLVGWENKMGAPEAEMEGAEIAYGTRLLDITPSLQDSDVWKPCSACAVGG